MSYYYTEQQLTIYNDWIAALRSGDYEEGTYTHMHTLDGKWSVIGVLADISVDGWWVPIHQVATLYAPSCPYYLLKTPRLRSYAVTAIPWSLFPGKHANQQDVYLKAQQLGFSFKQIADVMENKLLKRHCY